MKVLIIGHTGMLGNVVHKYLKMQNDVSTFIFSKKIDGRLIHLKSLLINLMVIT